MSRNKRSRKQKTPPAATVAAPAARDWSAIPSEALWFKAAADVQVVSPESGDESGPRFRMKLYTGTVLEHFFFGRTIMDLGTIKAAKLPMPALMQHDGDRIVGVIDTFNAGFDIGVAAEGELYDDTEEARILAGRLKRKFPYEASARFRPGHIVVIPEGRSMEVNGQKVDGPAEAWFDVEIREGSFTPFGLDRKTEASIAAGSGQTVDLRAALDKEKTIMEKEKQNEGEITEEDVNLDELKASAREEGVTAGIEEAKASEKKLLGELKAAFPERAQFVLDQFEAGHSVLEAKAVLSDLLLAENKELHDKLGKKGTDAVGFTASDGQNPPKEGSDAPTDSEAALQANWDKNAPVKDLKGNLIPVRDLFGSLGFDGYKAYAAAHPSEN